MIVTTASTESSILSLIVVIVIITLLGQKDFNSQRVVLELTLIWRMEMGHPGRWTFEEEMSRRWVVKGGCCLRSRCYSTGREWLGEESTHISPFPRFFLLRTDRCGVLLARFHVKVLLRFPAVGVEKAGILN